MYQSPSHVITYKNISIQIYFPDEEKFTNYSVWLLIFSIIYYYWCFLFWILLLQSIKILTFNSTIVHKLAINFTLTYMIISSSYHFLSQPPLYVMNVVNFPYMHALSEQTMNINYPDTIQPYPAHNYFVNYSVFKNLKLFLSNCEFSVNV